MMVWKMFLLSQGFILRFHVNLARCTALSFNSTSWPKGTAETLRILTGCRLCHWGSDGGSHLNYFPTNWGASNEAPESSIHRRVENILVLLSFWILKGNIYDQNPDDCLTWNLNIAQLKSGKSSEPNLKSWVPPLFRFQGVVGEQKKSPRIFQKHRIYS